MGLQLTPTGTLGSLMTTLKESRRPAIVGLSALWTELQHWVEPVPQLSPSPLAITVVARAPRMRAESLSCITKMRWTVRGVRLVKVGFFWGLYVFGACLLHCKAASTKNTNIVCGAISSSLTVILVFGCRVSLYWLCWGILLILGIVLRLRHAANSRMSMCDDFLTYPVHSWAILLRW